MANTESQGSQPVKRSIESLDAEDDSVPTTKKIKGEDGEESESSKGDKVFKKDKLEKPPQKEPGTNPNKRLGEELPGDTEDISPPKKRKVITAQGESDEKLDDRLHGNEEIEKRKRRIKNKALLKTIMEQMEFYFSDSNLSKDRYLRKLYDETNDGYIDLEVFNNFNKLKSLLKGEMSLNILSKALKKSKLLEMNEERTKVRRRTPLKEIDPEEVNKRTIYVEHLPSHASHAWIRKIFSQCGKVCYVSLPVYQTTKDIKGFAFVEFSSAEEAEKACTMLNNPPPTKTEEKPGRFPKGNKFLYRAQKILPSTSIKTEEPDSNDENLQSDSKEDQAISPTKKKKKKNLKRKAEEPVEKVLIPEQAHSQDEKKKKKKKKKKQTPMEDDGDVKEKAPSETKTSKGDSTVGVDIKPETPLTPSTSNLVKEQNVGIENVVSTDLEEKGIKKKKKRKKSKKSNTQLDSTNSLTNTVYDINVTVKNIVSENVRSDNMEIDTSNSEVKLNRKERKRLRQEDIRKKKAERAFKCKEELENKVKSSGSKEIMPKQESEEVPQDKSVNISQSSEMNDTSKVYLKSDGSQLTSCLVKSKKQDVVKKVEFDPVPVTTEFVERKEIRRRKKQKRESLHLRVISKKEWLSLRDEYIGKQKSHMAALKESLRELRMQEGTCQPPEQNSGKKHVDLTNVFGTKRMKPSQDVKLAHLEELKFIPNVIVQWKCSHEINRNKIKTMFKEIPSDRIAYVEGKEEAKSGYIRFKDEASAEDFARLSRSSDSFSARVLPESQQAAYWEKANQDRVAKLSRKKNERGTERIARKVFEKNKATFHKKGSHVVFDDDDDGDDITEVSNRFLASVAKDNQYDLEESFLAIFR